MPGSTPNYGLPYPELDEPANGPEAVQELAEAVDGAIALAVPAGTLLDYAGAAAPSGYLLADGGSYLRADYPALFAALGGASSPWGLPDGTHFNVPDFRGRVAVGKGTHADVDTLAENEGEAVGSRRPKHKHPLTRTADVALNDPGHAHQETTETDSGAGGASVQRSPDNSGQGLAAQFTAPALTGLTVSTQPTFTAGPQAAAPTDGPAYIVCSKIIKT